MQLIPQIRAVRLEIRVRWQRPQVIPGPVLANVLRGALGITLRKLVCPEGWLDHDCPVCPLYHECAYGQVFSPTPPADATQLRLQQDLPRPFVVEPPGLNPEERVTDDRLTFLLMLFGTAIDRLPYFISTLDRLGHDGMGRDRVPFQIERIASCHPVGDEVLFTGGSTTVTIPTRVIASDDVVSTRWPVEAPPAIGGMATRRRLMAKLGLFDFDNAAIDRPFDPNRPRIRLRFLTPLLLKSGSRIDIRGQRIPAQEIRDRPPFGILVRRLRDRVSSLCTFFGERWEHPDFAGIGEQADAVQLIESHTKWLTRSRQSTRTGQAHEISGLVGSAVYEFPTRTALNELLPLLKLAELLHIGKNAPWGHGAVRGVMMEGEEPE